MWRAAVIAFAIGAAASGAAEACLGPTFEQGIIYQRPPPSRWLPTGALMLDVSFDDVGEERADIQILTARVRRVVRGEYRRGTIRVVVPLSSCTIPVRSGTEGVIAVRPLPRAEGEPQSSQRSSRRCGADTDQSVIGRRRN
jgi:hypothetical protein